MSDNVTTSLRNSTSTPVSNGGEFTGIWEDTRTYSTLTISALGDQAFSVIVEQSNQDPADIGNVRSVDSTETTAVSASTQTDITVSLTGGFVRVRVTNSSGSDQTSLSIVTKLLTTSAGGGLSASDQAKLDGIAGGTGDLLFQLDADWQMPSPSAAPLVMTGTNFEVMNFPVGEYYVEIMLSVSQEVISSNEMRFEFNMDTANMKFRGLFNIPSAKIAITGNVTTANLTISSAANEPYPMRFFGILAVTTQDDADIRIGQDVATAGQLITLHEGSYLRAVKLS